MQLPCSEQSLISLMVRKRVTLVDRSPPLSWSAANITRRDLCQPRNTQRNAQLWRQNHYCCSKIPKIAVNEETKHMFMYFNTVLQRSSPHRSVKISPISYVCLHTHIVHSCCLTSSVTYCRRCQVTSARHLTSCGCDGEMGHPYSCNTNKASIELCL